MVESNSNEYDGSIKEGKRMRFWKKVNYQLVEYHSLPGYLKDDEYILGYYRSEWPLKQIFLSIFSIHNETLNVWTHFIGFFLFSCAAHIYSNQGSKGCRHAPLATVVTCAEKSRSAQDTVRTCCLLPFATSFSDLQWLKDELKTSLPLMNKLTSTY